jgi:hypothetical protein
MTVCPVAEISVLLDENFQNHLRSKLSRSCSRYYGNHILPVIPMDYGNMSIWHLQNRSSFDTGMLLQCDVEAIRL